MNYIYIFICRQYSFAQLELVSAEQNGFSVCFFKLLFVTLHIDIISKSLSNNIKFYEYGDDNDDDNDDNSKDSVDTDNNNVNYIISIFHTKLHSLHVVMCCFFFSVDILNKQTPPVLQNYNQWQTYP